jgi:hypothetical protein
MLSGTSSGLAIFKVGVEVEVKQFKILYILRSISMYSFSHRQLTLLQIIQIPIIENETLN